MDANLFAEGSIYFYVNKSNSKRDYHNDDINHDFLVSRPVYVIKQKPAPCDDFTINVVSITSSKRRVGIGINIDGLKDGKILPARIYSVHKEYLAKYMGRASDEIIKEVSDALEYHFGNSDEKPKYILEYETEVERTDAIVNNLTLKEKYIYDFITQKCLFKDNYYIIMTELYNSYIKAMSKSDNIYNKLQNFSRAITKMCNIFPDISIKEQNHIKIIYGISLNGNVHKVEDEVATDNKVPRKRAVMLERSNLQIDTMSKEELINALTNKGKKIYEKLDVIEKIQKFNVPAEKIELDGLLDEDRLIIKKLIDDEITDKKRIVYKLLDEGQSPTNLNTIHQYIMFISPSRELLKHVKHKYLKKGGIGRLKRELRNNVKHYFVKI